MNAESLRPVRRQAAVPTVWHPTYSSDAAPLTSSSKQALVVERAEAEELLDVVWAPYDARATWREIARIHDRAYVAAVRTGHPRALAESQGFTWSPRFAESVARIWSGHVAASRLALTEQVVLHPTSGSHHAKRHRGAGVCTFAYVLGGCLPLLEAGHVDRVLLVDVDAHYGDGHDELTRADPRFVHFDICGGQDRPVRRTERGIWAEVGSAESYHRVLATELPALLKKSRPGLVQLLAGVDCFEHDDVGGIPGMDASLLASRDHFVLRLLSEAAVPTVVSLAGGYSPETIDLHLETVRLIREARRNRVSTPGRFCD